MKLKVQPCPNRLSTDGWKGALEMWQVKWTVSKAQSLEWESTGKRARRVITIRLRLISTPVTVWFMTLCLQPPNSKWATQEKEIGRGTEKEKRGKKIPTFYLSNFTLHTEVWTKTQQLHLCLPQKHPPRVCFVVLFPFLEKRQIPGNTFVLTLLNVLLYSELSDQFEGCCILAQKELSTRKAESAWHIPWHRVFLYLFVWEGCRPALQFR